jgi:hypothetical protein
MLILCEVKRLRGHLGRVTTCMNVHEETEHGNTFYDHIVFVVVVLFICVVW